MADLQAEIPEVVEQVLDHLLAMGGQLVGQQEQEIDVGMGRQLAAAVAADGHQGQPLGRRGIGQWVSMSCGKIMQRAQELIDEEARLADGLAAVPAFARTGAFEAAADLGPAGGERGFQLRQHGRALLRRPVALGDGGQAAGEGAAVDDGALVADVVHEALRLLSPSRPPQE